jgi:dephospho-CoA kinase
MKLFGLAGTNGSGKDTVGQILAEQHNFLFISMSDMLREEAARRGQAVERDTLRTISAEWRRESGLGVLIDKAVEHYNQKGGDSKYAGLAVASVRNPGEVDRIHELGGKLVWTDADPKIRYDRIFSRQRTAEDSKSFEQFLAEEQAEMQHSGDEATLSVGDVKAKADIFLLNESTLEDFEAEISQKLDL